MVANKRDGVKLFHPKNPNRQQPRTLPPPKPLKRLQKKKQLPATPTQRLMDILEEVMMVIADFMVAGEPWVSQEEVFTSVMTKDVIENLNDREVFEALRCGMMFGLIMKNRQQRYSLPRRVFEMVEEGNMPDLVEMMEDWNERPKRIGNKRLCKHCIRAQ